MKNCTLALACLLFVHFAHAQPPSKKSFTAKLSTEAIVTFQTIVELRSPIEPTEVQARAQIDKQLHHLFGPLSAAEAYAVPKEDYDYQIVAVKKILGVWKIQYTYRGIMQVRNGPTTSLDVILPVDPDLIYQAAMLQDFNPCTNPHYQSESDFWYFWDPTQLGCRLKKDKDFVVIKAQMQRIPNTKITYPEYDRLADKKGVVRVMILLGMDDPSNDHNPNESEDLNAETYTRLRQSLTALGFSNAKKLTPSELGSIMPPTEAHSAFVEKTQKAAGKFIVEVTLFFGPSGINEESRAFRYLYKYALENASIMIFDGHSGLGGNLSLDNLEYIEHQMGAKNFSINLPQKYQIYYFNSCTSYSYYNSSYFDRKKSATDPKGTKNLDIMTNGLQTMFAVMHHTNEELLNAADGWLHAIQSWSKDSSVASYQTIANQIDSQNLFGINGDEDNPTQAPGKK